MKSILSLKKEIYLFIFYQKGRCIERKSREISHPLIDSPSGHIDSVFLIHYTYCLFVFKIFLKFI